MKKIIIEGKNINNIETFYEEVNRVFMLHENWKIAQSLDAFNDMLYGSFGEIKGKEKIQLIWKDMEQNQKITRLSNNLGVLSNQIEISRNFQP